MDTPALFFVTDRQSPEHNAAAHLESVLAHWHSNAQRLEPTVLSVADVLARPAQLQRGGVIWLMLDEPRASNVYELLDVIDQSAMPALLTRAGETQPLGAAQQEGVVICPPDTPAAVCCAMLQSLAVQSAQICSMQNELRFLQTDEGGVFDRITRMDEELRLASQLQQQFLPSELPTIDDVSVHALWRPAHYVSGDIYDVTRLDEHHLGLFLADAVGHGVPAALMTMYIKRSLRTKSISPDEPGGYRLLEPSETLARLNRDMIEAQNERVHFATAVYGVLDCRTRELRVARAGHPAPILLRHDDAAGYIEPDGGLLGVFEQEFEQKRVTLNPGDRLLMYSDGFEVAFPKEAADGRHILGTDQYTHELSQLRHADAEAALQHLNERVNAQSGSLNQHDDLTVLCTSVATDKEQPHCGASSALNAAWQMSSADRTTATMST